jgi:hypothetical protein
MHLPVPYTDRATGLAFFLSRLFELDPQQLHAEAHALAVAARADPTLAIALPWAAVMLKAAEAIAAMVDAMPEREGILLAFEALQRLDAAALDAAVSAAGEREEQH